MKRIIGLGCLVLLLCASCKEKPAPPVQRLPQVGAVAVVKGKIPESFSAIGTVKAMDEVDIVARVEGFLQKKFFTEGQMVKKGEQIYQIEPDLYQAEVENAQATLDSAKIVYDNANKEFQRHDRLIKQNATSESVYDNVKAAMLEAKAKVEVAEANLAIAKLNLNYTKILAPFDGKIGLVSISEGNLVNQQSGRLANIVNLNPIRAEFIVTEMDLLKLKKRDSADVDNDKINVRLYLQDGSEYPTLGKLAYSDNQINSKTGTLKLQALFDNPEFNLVPGMFIKLEIEEKHPADSLVIPLTAILTDQAGDYVYLLSADNQVSRRNIDVGSKNAANATVTEGLAENDRVISVGQQKVRPGMKVAIMGAETKHAE